MNATKRLVARAGLVVCSVLTVALTGCRTQVVHERTRTVYVPAPVPPPPVIVSAPPASTPQPPPVVVVAPPEPSPVVVIQSESDFYEPLNAYGSWVVVGAYGRCWIPARVDAGWRPYANGYWQRTDAGWYWASDEPWGWATYHYGRWDFNTQFGWIWVPQTQWAPAWVAWREGGGYVGWAPLRPTVTIGVNIGRVDYEPAFASRAFVFVEHRRMLEPVRPKTVVVNNTTIINQTVNITNVKVVNRTVINEGPRPEVIERESGRKVQAVPAREFRHREETTVATRERNIPTGHDRKNESSARPAPQVVEKKPVPPPVTRPDERPVQVVTRSSQPLDTPVRPEMGSAARRERNPENEIGRRVTPLPPTVAPKAQTEMKSEQAVLSRREVRAGERPVVAAKPTPQPATTLPVRDERKHEQAIERKNPTTPSVVEPKPKQEVRLEPRRELRPPAKVEAVPPSAVKKQTTPPSEMRADKRPISPREKSQAEQGRVKQANKPKKQGEDQEVSAPEPPTRPPR